MRSMDTKKFELHEHGHFLDHVRTSVRYHDHIDSKVDREEQTLTVTTDDYTLPGGLHLHRVKKLV